MKKKMLLGVCAALILSGCATASKLNSVQVGMDRAEVEKVMGKPVSVSAQGNAQYLNFRLSETDDHAFYGITTPYYVRLIDGKVESFGRTGDFDSTKTPTVRVESDQKVKTESEPDLYTELQKLQDLKDKGLLTEDEFKQQKQRLLDKTK